MPMEVKHLGRKVRKLGVKAPSECFEVVLQTFSNKIKAFSELLTTSKQSFKFSEALSFFGAVSLIQASLRAFKSFPYFRPFTKSYPWLKAFKYSNPA